MYSKLKEKDMKLIILVIFSLMIISTCYSQEFKPYWYENKSITIKDINDYFEYCYNDSTICDYKQKFNIIDGKLLYGGLDSVYCHNHIATFIGFYIWLNNNKEKIKIEQ
jgi:hypothetical protein